MYAGQFRGPNAQVLAGVGAPPIFVCPSNPMPVLTRIWFGTPRTFNNSYTAIAGANVDPGMTTPRIHSTGRGPFAFNGILFVNSRTRIHDISDGTSNVMLLGEQTDWTIDSGGRRNVCRSTGVGDSFSFWSGVPNTRQNRSPSGHQHFMRNTTTISTPLAPASAPAARPITPVGSMAGEHRITTLRFARLTQAVAQTSPLPMARFVTPCPT